MLIFLEEKNAWIIFVVAYVDGRHIPPPLSVSGQLGPWLETCHNQTAAELYWTEFSKLPNILVQIAKLIFQIEKCICVKCHNHIATAQFSI